MSADNIICFGWDDEIEADEPPKAAAEQAVDSSGNDTHEATAKESGLSFDDDLPPFMEFDKKAADNPPPLAVELIKGILRLGHKMIITGASKAGKTFLLIELGLAIACGVKWLGFECRKGKVLYINFEIDGASFQHRVKKVMGAMGLSDYSNPITIWNLRGKNLTIEKLAPALVKRIAKSQVHYDCIILDPLYKISGADENSAKEVAELMNWLDLICSTTNASLVFCHHHSKGAQTGKYTIDRASGSGVFARDPDAILDLMQLDLKNTDIILPRHATAWRVSATLREFETPDSIEFVFQYPIHEVRSDMREAKELAPKSKRENGKKGNDSRKQDVENKYKRVRYVVESWEEIDTKEEKTSFPTLKEIETYFKSDRGFSAAAIRRWINAHDDYEVQKGIVVPKFADAKK